MLPVLLTSSEYPSLVNLILFVYERICHGIDERSIYIDGKPMAVCARCLGIYAGYVLGLIVYPFFRRVSSTNLPQRRWLILAMVPMGIDVLLSLLGFFDNTHLTRTLTGLIAGAAGAFYTLPGLVSTGAVLRSHLFSFNRVIQGGRQVDRQT